MKIVMKNILTLLLLVGFLGCKPKETHLSGQIFIVTRGAENIKLGLVEVQLIEKAQVLGFLQKKQAVIESEIVSRQLEYTAAKANFDYADMQARREKPLLELSEYKQEKETKLSKVESLRYFSCY